MHTTRHASAVSSCSTHLRFVTSTWTAIFVLLAFVPPIEPFGSCHAQVEDETTVAGHPAAVRSFLLSLLDEVKAPARAELDSLQRLARHLSPSATDGLQAWDQQFYRQLAMVSDI